MTVRIFAGMALAAMLWSAPSFAQPPAEAFGNLPFIDQPQLSPDGKHFVAIQDLDGKPAAVIYTVNAGGTPQVFASSDWTIARVRWLKNDRVEVLTTTGSRVPLGSNPERYTWYRALSVEVGTNAWTQLFDRNNDSVGLNSNTGVLVDRIPDDPNYVLIPLWTRPKNDRVDNDVNAAVMGGSTGDYRLSLYRVDVHNGHAAVIQDGTQYGAYWLTDGVGQIVGRVDLTHTPLTEHLYLGDGSGSSRDVRDFAADDDKGANILGLTADGNAFARFARAEDGRQVLMALDRNSGADAGVLYANPAYDVSNVLIDDWTMRVIGAVYAADRFEYVYFDPARKKLQADIEKAFPGMDAHAYSVTRDGKAAIVVATTPQRPATYYYLDTTSDRATPIASEYPGLTEADLGEVKPMVYRARDGLEIHAYLTLPPGRSGAKGLPLVVLPHGGPDRRDGWHFDWLAQFLANRGYAVLQPNYRGSFGYGHRFTEAGYHQWGLKIQDDVSDGVKALIADGTADPKRVCIAGIDIGGYIALAGATFSPELYACAVSIAGISELDRMMTVQRRNSGDNSQTMSYWTARIGTDTAQLEATSPAMHADRVQAPILLVHGKNYVTVPINQSEEERDALQRAGKPVELVELDSDDHYFRLAATRIRMLTEVERFLRAHIGN
jgi:dipeptidyl aminopeptidase/acylaminoacyl peptidase